MLAGAASLPAWPASAQPQLLTRTIPSTGEAVPAVGMGTWITFNVGTDPALRADRAGVTAAFLEAGGRVIDSSPMYGSSQDVLGYALDRVGRPDGLFAADKVWTSSKAAGPDQIAASERKWGVSGFDLMQVHNLRAWQAHLPMLFDRKAAGEIRYVGISTSEGRRHDAFEDIMRSQPLDFVQVSYNVANREVEERILPLARDRGIAVIVNRPFQQDRLTRWLEGRPLPGFADEIGASTWAQVLLKFILAEPAVTVAIPATTKAEHARENVAAASGPLPDRAMRERIVTYLQEL
nr:aldo/keto reductase [Amorphus orientalis]